MKQGVLFAEKVTFATVVDPKLKEDLNALRKAESQVIIHVTHHACYTFCTECRISLDRLIHLQPHTSSRQCKLVQIIKNGIEGYEFPIDGQITKFSLVFEGLPKNAKAFDFIEPGPGGWRLLSIARNNTDIYSIQIKRDLGAQLL